jgi:toxin CptA
MMPMEIAVLTLAFALAAPCAALMGYAIQRGATCTVAAVDEVVTMRRFGRLASLVEASIWVGGGLLVATALHAMPPIPPGHAAGAWTLLGGALLGLGAWINGGCAFGTVARLGSGEWAYALTPIGFYAGCMAANAWLASPATPPLARPSPVIAAGPWLVWPFIAFAAWRAARAGRALRAPRAGAKPLDRGLEARIARVWEPHAATTVIALAFVAMLLLVGAWAYTDALADLALGMWASLPARLGLFAALLGGALLGGRAAGPWRHVAPTPAQAARCLAGGALIGGGTLLTPGGNDVLVLVGMPLLWPYAWLAFATMCATVAVAQLAARAFAVRRLRRPTR